MDIPQTDVATARSLFDAGRTTFLDIRDEASFQAGHIPGATRLDDSRVSNFIASADKQTEVVVYCYHGNSSLGATSFFIEQGFTKISSMAGGFEAWQQAGGESSIEPK